MGPAKVHGSAMRTLPLILLATGGPLNAATGGSTPVPEPSNLVLFAMGLAGVAIGRRFARSKNRK